MITAAIITIGDEILIGQIIDTNSAQLGKWLATLGIRVIHRSSVPDNEQHIVNAMNEAKKYANLIIITGGLGPTKDDVTKKALCEYFSTTLVENETVLKWVSEIFAMRKIPLIHMNKMQAMVPAGCEVLFNKSGTAPGMWFDLDSKVFISMPGVPFEMKTIFEDEVVPRIKSRFTLSHIIHRTIQTSCIGESFLAEKIAPWENDLPEHIKLAYLPSVGSVRLRLSAYGSNKAKLQKESNRRIDALYDLIGEYIFGEEDNTLQLVLGKLLREKQCFLSTAESCTGGYIAHLITSVPGSSAYYKGSVVSYANEIKMNELGVSPEVLRTQGAVSETCVLQMAEGIRKKFKTDYAIATSGIAGPDGGSARKPVGTVWIAISSKERTIAKQYSMGNHRERTIQRTAIHAMDMLRRMMLELPL